MLLIESADGRFRAEVDETPDGISFRLLRYAGPADLGVGQTARWRVMETGINDIPFHLALDRLHEIVWNMQDDRPRAWPTRRRT